MKRHIRFSTARQVFDAFATAAHDIETPPTADDPLVFLNALVTGPTPEDAISFCAYLLPRREAVWWACQCLRQIEDSLSPLEEDLIGTAEAWVKDPDEPARQAAAQAAGTAPRQSPATWVAFGAAWSGGSISGAGNPPVPPPPYATAQAVRAAVLTALANVNWRERRDYLNASVMSALKLIDPDLVKA
jgi:hypothetical protein